MSGLVIDHGNPWWLSPNVWAVSASHPTDSSPGELSPVAGKQYFLKAQVRNTETFRINNVQVNLYWAHSSLAITRSNAHLVGNAFVSVDGGKTAEVLCLSPWVPTFVIQGHECLIAEIAQENTTSSLLLDAINDPHVAQRNLSVVMTLGPSSFHFPFEVSNLERNEQIFTINAQQANQEQLAAVVHSFGHDLHIPLEGTIGKLGFIRTPFPDPHTTTETIPRVEELKLGPYERLGYSAVGELEGNAALIHVTQTIENRVVGGLSILVIHRQKEQ